ncbi:MAG TPA: SlyX family protein [Gammaproteobacteria bacterium]
MSIETLEAKLIDLEIRYAHQQNHVDELDKVIYRQQQMIDRLNEKINLMEKRLKTFGESNILRPEEDSPPPHY